MSAAKALVIARPKASSCGTQLERQRSTSSSHGCVGLHAPKLYASCVKLSAKTPSEPVARMRATQVVIQYVG